MQIPLILASASPRRERLLAEHAYDFRVVAPRLREPDLEASGLAPACIAAATSYFKARAVGEHCDGDWVLAADTLACDGTSIIGKPADRDHARHILNRLAGTRHAVITGVALWEPATGRRDLRADCSWVTMRRVSPDELEAYLEGGAWWGKAGAYGVQDRDDPFVERIEGSYSNVVGLPMELLARMIADFAVRPG